MATPTYNSVILKISGEYFSPDVAGASNIDMGKMLEAARQIQEAAKLGVKVGVVLGAGNIYRGKEADGTALEQTTADYMGMLASVLNALALRDTLRSIGCKAEALSSVTLGNFLQVYGVEKARRLFEKGFVVIFTCGTGNPYFTTDTLAAVRALELQVDAVMKGSQVDGVYDKDPHKFSDAKKYDTLSMDEAIEKKLKVMDATAFTLCRDHQVPVYVFDFHKPGNFVEILKGEAIGTRVLNS